MNNNAQTVDYSCKFSDGGWSQTNWSFVKRPDTLFTAYCWQQEKEYIANTKTAGSKEWNQTAMVLPKMFSGSIKIKARLEVGTGSPAIVFVSQLKNGENGAKLFERHYEIVFSKNAIGVWCADYQNKLPWKRIAQMTVALETDKPIDVEVWKNDMKPSQRVDYGKQLEIKVRNNNLKISGEMIAEEYYIGINSGEGLSKFFDFSYKQ